MTNPITIQRIEKILGKRRLGLVYEILQDSECTEVILEYPYANMHWEETVHTFPHDHFLSWDEGGTMTVADYRAELIEWFDNVAEDPSNSNYLKPAPVADTTPGAALAALRRQVEKSCDHCGDTFTGIKKARFCSEKCRFAAAYKRRSK